MTKKITSINEMIKFSDKVKNAGHSLGFVPTMGFLHEGHLSLVKASKKECQMTVVSIYVNPTQFGPNEDFETYPRDFERDFELLKDLEVDAVFFPNNKDMYPENFQTYVEVEKITKILCGAKRPGHFKGVTTIVSKLINIVNPDKMFMGEKDFQQLAVLRTMSKDLNFRTKIIGCPIKREEDGLAMSSRNKNLTDEERVLAASLYNSAKSAISLFKSGENNSRTLIEYITKHIEEKKGKIDYVEIRDSQTLEIVEKVYSGCRIFLAVKYGTVRLIDNHEVT